MKQLIFTNYCKPMINKHLSLEGHDAKVNINAIEVRLAGSCSQFKETSCK
jgi:hypothetical protein